MSTPPTRAQAKTWTIGAQAGALICVLGAVAVGVVGLPDHDAGTSLQRARNSILPSNTTDPKADGIPAELDPFRSTQVDTLGLAERLSLLDNAPLPPAPTVDPTPEDPKDPGTDEETIDIADATIMRRVKYIGFINSSSTQHAFIRIDGKQRIVSVGDTAKAGDEQFPDLSVDRITPSYIRLSDGESSATIDLMNKSGPSVTMVDGNTIETATPTNDEDESLLTAEEEAYIESLPPRQRQRERRRMEREKRGLPPENQNRRPTPEPLVKIRGNMNETNQPSRVDRRND